MLGSRAVLPAVLHAWRQACLQACPQLPEGSLGVTLIVGGISNSLFKVGPLEGSTPAAVMLRIYGDNTEAFIDREKEMATMRLLHRYGFGPELLATFANGRIESYIPSRALEPEEMASAAYAPRIAAKLARFHATPAPCFAFEDPQKQAVFRSFDFGQMKAEVAALQAAAAATGSPTVFAHNDLLSGNILVPADVGGGDAAGNRMTFIDFEYAEWAPRGFDLGNHFVEYGGNDNDYSKYPSQEQAACFCRAYLRASGSGDGGGGAEPSEAAVAALVAEANLFALASLQYWGSWGLLQAKWSAIDFDFLSYSKGRWDEYFKRRDAFMAAAAAVFGSGSSSGGGGGGQ